MANARIVPPSNGHGRFPARSLMILSHSRKAVGLELVWVHRKKEKCYDKDQAWITPNPNPTPNMQRSTDFRIILMLDSDIIHTKFNVFV
jgi:hypothetical protein